MLEHVELPMRDGVVLRADVYFPSGPPRTDGEPARGVRSETAAPGVWPVLVLRTADGRRERAARISALGRYWARKGFAFVAQDVRGRWTSDGSFRPFIQEADDGRDTLDWVARQPWCCGDVGMTGEGYAGYAQWAVAASGHPALKALALGGAAADVYGVWAYHGGAFCLATMGEWAFSHSGRRDVDLRRLDRRHLPLVEAPAAAGHPCAFWDEVLAHPCRDAFWAPLTLVEDYASVSLPILHYGGWYDVFLKGTLDGWRAVTGRSESRRARERQWLVVGPDDNAGTVEREGRAGLVPAPGAGFVRDRVKLFFDHWLKGRENGWPERPRVELYVLGRDAWHAGDDWPPADTDFERWYLASGGGAATAAGDGVLHRGKAPPTVGEPLVDHDTFTCDPDDPVSPWLGRSVWALAAGLEGRAGTASRPDVLCYTSAALDADVELVGPIVATLSVASDGTDADVAAALFDVHPDGRAQLIQEGITRLSRCRGDVRVPDLEPGVVKRAAVDLGATGYLVAASHRLRLEVSGSLFDRFDRNLNSGESSELTSDHRVAQTSVFHSPAHTSFVTLPVVRG
ncbi:MAG TPA: CocE/NonD family hydrolase [Thermoleophilia bacterium]|nr:CocE/NonD family hydrolase [Thermoleophilia bacterium]